MVSLSHSARKNHSESPHTDVRVPPLKLLDKVKSGLVDGRAYALGADRRDPQKEEGGGRKLELHVCGDVVRS